MKLLVSALPVTALLSLPVYAQMLILIYVVSRPLFIARYHQITSLHQMLV